LGTAKASPVLSLSTFRSYPTWLKIAAALVIGLGLGRLTMLDSWNGASGENPSAVAQADAEGLRNAPERSNLPYRIAAQEHLNQTEALLTGFRSSVRDSATRVEMGPWARGLLAQTRLLMDSPAAEDAELASLLSDLEFVLAQIVQLRGDDNDEEFGYIDDGLEERQVLLRIQTVAAQSPTRL
jgi:N-acetyl-gamma-glutamylphosphate reductase